jgi:hypothetical protein
MQIKAMTDTTDLTGRMKLWAELVKKETGSGIKQFARVACENLAHNTQPYGKDEDAKKKGEHSVDAGVSSVYYTTKDKGFRAGMVKSAESSYSKRNNTNGLGKFKNRLDRYISSNNTGALTKLVADFGWKNVLLDEIDPSLHKNARSKVTGRVTKRRASLHLVIGAERELEKYRKTMIDRVGLTKAGWAKCADLIPIADRVSSATRGFPQWVKRHRNKLARGKIIDKSNDESNPRVVMTNLTPWCSRVLTDKNAQNALDIARNKFVEYMNRQIKYELRQKAKLRGSA